MVSTENRPSNRAPRIQSKGVKTRQNDEVQTPFFMIFHENPSKTVIFQGQNALFWENWQKVVILAKFD